MHSSGSQRKLSNVRLTAKYHYRHMGLWIMLSIGFLIAVNAYFHLLVAAQMRSESLSAAGPGNDYLLVRPVLLVVQAIEFALFAFGIVSLAKFTSHRIAGPYIRLQNVFRQVRDGNMECRLKFRSYDHLEDVEYAFNEMMESLRAARTGSRPAADREGPPT